MDYVLLLSAIQGLLAAASVWQSERDHKLSIQAYEEAKSRALVNPEIRQRAIALEGELPPDVALVFLKNIDNCWDRHKKCIYGATTEEELEYCEIDNQKCICANLKYMANARGCLPNELVHLWNTWTCGVKPRIC